MNNSRDNRNAQKMGKPNSRSKSNPGLKPPFSRARRRKEDCFSYEASLVNELDACLKCEGDLLEVLSRVDAKFKKTSQRPYRPMLYKAGSVCIELGERLKCADTIRQFERYAEFFKQIPGGTSDVLKLYQSAGHAFNKIKAHDEAVRCLEQAIELCPLEHTVTLAWLNHIMASTYCRQDDYDRARVFSDRSYRLNSENPPINVQRAKILLHFGEKEEAKEMLDLALEQSPNDQHAFVQLVRCLAMERLFKSAVSVLGKIEDRRKKGSLENYIQNCMASGPEIASFQWNFVEGDGERPVFDPTRGSYPLAVDFD